MKVSLMAVRPSGVRRPHGTACRPKRQPKHTGYSHTAATRMVPTYTKRDVQLIKVAPDDGLVQSETCRASNAE